MKTIIYLTDNSLDEALALKCREILVREAGDNPIISVSQKPIELGTNICVGEIGRNWFSLYKQQLAGLHAAKTKFIAIAEHDCLYTNEHFSFDPLRDDTFYYNANCWLVQWGGNHPELNGMYSKWHGVRYALSQLICSRELLIASIEERLALIENGVQVVRKAGEPGCMPLGFRQKVETWAKSGAPVQLQRYLKDYLEKYRSETFETVNPNLDIRHGSNFTGPKRGKRRRYSLEYWGEFKNLWEGGEIHNDDSRGVHLSYLV